MFLSYLSRVYFWPRFQKHPFWIKSIPTFKNHPGSIWSPRDVFEIAAKNLPCCGTIKNTPNFPTVVRKCLFCSVVSRNIPNSAIPVMCQGAGGFACKCKRSPALYVNPPVVSLIKGLHVGCTSQPTCLKSKDPGPSKAERLRVFSFPPPSQCRT